MTLTERYRALIAGLVPLKNAFDGHKQWVDPSKVTDALQGDDKTVTLFFSDGSKVDVIGVRDEIVGELGLVDRLPRETQKPAAAEAAAKRDKPSVNYVDDSGGKEPCQSCKYFLASAQGGSPSPGACQLVDGAISPAGHCDLFAPAALVIDLAKDPKGQKIAQLIKEGYPQDQAIAIAYSEERQGTLKGNAARRDVVMRGATGQARMETLGGREYLAVPVVALVEGVIWPINAPKPEMVPAGVFSVAPQSWNGRPVFCGHPVNAEGEQVSGNTPDKLPNAFGLVQNARTDGKRLLMEAWLDVAKCQELGGAALQTLERARAGEPIEISVGAFTLTAPGVGSFGGRSYAETWAELYPDHLALLPPGSEGACSLAMGCGVRAAVAHRIARSGVQWEPMSAQPEQGMLARLGALLSKFGAAGSGEPDWATEIEAAEAELQALAGARHSRRDMALVQAVHDQAVELGATCAPKAAGAKPDGDANMTKCEKAAAIVKGLKAEVKAKYEAAAKKSGGDIMAAILAQIKEKFGLSDAAAADLENLAESTLAELAGLAAPSDNPPADGTGDNPPPPAGATKQDPPAAATPSYSEAKPKTAEQWLAEAPAEIKTLVADARAKEDARKAVLITAIVKVAKDEYTEAELKAMSVKDLERINKIAKANAPADIDFSGQAVARAAEGQEQAVPAPPDMTAMIRERQAKK